MRERLKTKENPTPKYDLNTRGTSMGTRSC